MDQTEKGAIIEKGASILRCLSLLMIPFIPNSSLCVMLRLQPKLKKQVSEGSGRVAMASRPNRVCKQRFSLFF